MKKKTNDFAKYLTNFLSKYLPGEQNVSSNTVASYRDSFKLFLLFWEKSKGYKTDGIRMEKITKDSVIEFLDWIETERKCSISTRNQRLASLHAFFRYVQKESPENLVEINKILAIPMKKKAKPIIPFLTADELKILLEQPDQTQESGKRDLVLMVVLYDTGARVQELIDLTVKDIRLNTPAVVTLQGKGRKSRQIPIMGKTFDLLNDYLKNLQRISGFAEQDTPIFYNQLKTKLTRRGVSYILNKYVEMARNIPGFYNKGIITPHVFRHTKASHMIQAGIELTYIRDFLGHSTVLTTEIYARADTEMKRKALESAYVELGTEKMPSWENNGDLMNWLQELCK
jgi:integrase/recombinase XerD